jgi:hypothetical protein
MPTGMHADQPSAAELLVSVIGQQQALRHWRAADPTRFQNLLPSCRRLERSPPEVRYEMHYTYVYIDS